LRRSASGAFEENRAIPRLFGSTPGTADAEFDFQAIADAANNIGTISLAE